MNIENPKDVFAVIGVIIMSFFDRKKDEFFEKKHETDTVNISHTVCKNGNSFEFKCDCGSFNGICREELGRD